MVSGMFRAFMMILCGFLLLACGSSHDGDSNSAGASSGDEDSDADADDDDNDDDNNNDDQDGPPLPPAITRVDGGLTGHDGVSIAAAGDRLYAAACRGRELVLFRRGPDGAWSEQPLHPAASAPSLAADSAGSLHLAFLDTRWQVLRYATNRSGEWRFQRIGRASLWEQGKPRLVVDANRHAHVCYADGGGHLAYATNAPGEWRTDSVIELNSSCWCDLAVGRDGTAHLSTVVYDWGGVPTMPVYARGGLAGWRLTYLWPNVDTRAAIALDESDRPHLFYQAEYPVDSRLRETWPVGDRWLFRTVDRRAVLSDNDVRAVRDPAGKLNVYYVDEAAGALKRAVRQAAGWRSEVVRPGYAVRPFDPYRSFAYLDAAFDDRGAPHVAAFSPHEATLWHAELTGDAWSAEALDRASERGVYLDFVLGVDDVSRIAYVDADAQTIRYADDPDGAWRFETAYHGAAGAFALHDDNILEHPLALAMDAAGAPHIAFADYVESAVLHGVREDGAWRFEKIWSGEKAYWVDIAAGDDGRLHAAFFRAPARLTYAVREENGWTAAEQDLPFDREGDDLTLALDAHGAPHLIAAGHAPADAPEQEVPYLTLLDPTLDGPWPTWPIAQGRGAVAAYDAGSRLHLAFTAGDYYVAERAVYRLTRGGDNYPLSPKTCDLAAIAFDAAQQPHLACHDFWTEGGLYHLAESDGVWRATDIDPAPSALVIGWPARIAIDSRGRARLAYFADHALYYAVSP